MIWNKWGLALILAIGVYFGFMADMAYAQGPTITRVCAPQTLNPTSGTMHFTSYYTPTRQYNAGYEFYYDISGAGGTGEVKFYDDLGAEIATSSIFPGTATISNTNLLFGPGAQHLTMSTAFSWPSVNDITLDLCYYDLDPPPDFTTAGCDLLASTEGAPTYSQWVFTTTEVYSYTQLNYILDDSIVPVSTLWGGFKLFNDVSLPEFDTGLYGTGLGLLYDELIYTDTLAVLSYTLQYNSVGVYHPPLGFMQFWGCNGQISTAFEQCTTLADSEFSQDYSTPAQSNYWMAPVYPPAGPLYFDPVPVVSNTLTLSYTAVTAPIIGLTTPATYTVVLSASAIISPANLVLAVVSGLTPTGELNHHHGDFSQLSSPIFTTALTITAPGLYTATLANVGYTNPHLLFWGEGVGIMGVCVSGAGILDGYCPTIPDSSFKQQSWFLGGLASYTTTLNTGVNFPPGGLVQALVPPPSFPPANQSLVLDVYSGTGTLGLELYYYGGATVYTTTVAVSAGIITQNIGVIVPFNALKIESITGTFTLDSICITTAGDNTSDCLQIVNPNFETRYGWYFANGATWNEPGETGYLPHVISGTWEARDLAVIGQLLAGPLPTLGDGQYLGLSFNARSIDGGPGYLAAQLGNTLNTATLDEFYQQYTYDYSAQAGAANISLDFINNGYQYGADRHAMLDNVCLFLTTTPITQPIVIQQTNQFDFGLSCFNISRWLSDTTGVDFPGLEVIAASGVSIWDAENWVTWLGAQLWANAGKPVVCTMLAIMRTGFFLNVLNVMAWIGSALTSWFGWISRLLVSGFLGWFRYAWQFATIYLTWFIKGPGWLIVLLFSAFPWLVNLLQSWGINVLNYLILAWNHLLPSASAVFSGLAELAVTLWNYISPMFSWLWSWLSVGGPGVAIFWNVIRTIMTLIWLAWDTIKDIETFPLTFYQSFSGAIDGSLLDFLPQCTAPGTAEMWCLVVVGIEIVNQTTSHSLVYPVVIVTLIALTIVIFWQNILSGKTS